MIPQRSEVLVHARRIVDEDVVDIGSLRVTSGAQTFLGVGAALHPADLLALGDALTRRGGLDAAALERRLSRADRVRGVARARQWAPHLTAGAASPPESRIRYWLLASDLPKPCVPVPPHDRWGRVVARADLGHPEWKVALGYEGGQHAEREQFRRDIDRYSLTAADGWIVPRFAARHVQGGAVVVDRTRRARLSAAGDRGCAGPGRLDPCAHWSSTPSVVRSRCGRWPPPSRRRAEWW